MVARRRNSHQGPQPPVIDAFYVARVGRSHGPDLATHNLARVCHLAKSVSGFLGPILECLIHQNEARGLGLEVEERNNDPRHLLILVEHRLVRALLLDDELVVSPEKTGKSEAAGPGKTPVGERGYNGVARQGILADGLHSHPHRAALRDWTIDPNNEGIPFRIVAKVKENCPHVLRGSVDLYLSLHGRAACQEQDSKEGDRFHENYNGPARPSEVSRIEFALVHVPRLLASQMHPMPFQVGLQYVRRAYCGHMSQRDEQGEA